MVIDWLYPWIPVEIEADRRIFERELISEAGAGHPLFGLTATAIGRVDGLDDILFDLRDGRVAEVHLTWRGRTEIDSRFPRTAVFASVVQWSEESMRPRHDEEVASAS